MARKVPTYICAMGLICGLTAQNPLSAAGNVVAPGEGRISAETSEKLGLSKDRLDRIDEFLKAKVQSGDMAGAVILVARHGRIAHLSAVGYADLGDKRKMERDTIFRLYSMTKPITATALMMLYEEGKFTLYDPVSKYIPEFKGVRVLRTPDSPITDTVPADREIFIHDLFRHAAGFTAGGEPDKSAVDAAYIKADLFGLDTSLEQMVARLAKIPLHYQPDTRYSYGIASDVQARLVEIFSGMPFDRFLQERLFDPLGMKDTGFWVPPAKANRLSPVHWAKDGKLVPCDEVHGCPKPDYYLLESSNINSYTHRNAHTGGSYGLVGTAEDYWRFAQMMLNGGQFKGRRYLSPATVRFMTLDHLAPIKYPGAIGQSVGLGFGLMLNPALSGTIRSVGTYYWGGAAATSFWIDPKEDMVVVVMTQHMVAPSINDVTNRIEPMVYGALVK